MNSCDVIDEIWRERINQACKGYDAAHDDGHIDGTLFKAAGALIAEGTDTYFEYSMTPADCRWIDELLAKVKFDRRRQLVLAAAFIVAEIERIDRIHKKREEDRDVRSAGETAGTGEG